MAAFARLPWRFHRYCVTRLETYCGVVKLQARAKRQLSPSAPSGSSITNKKDEDNAYDIEAAVLTGGGAGGFQPLAGLVRGAPWPLNNKIVVRGTHQLDRVFVGLDQRPLARAAMLVYIMVLHLVAIFV